ncbi:zinc transporter ZIP3 [Rhinichthys klamathensis goyatoka]|uniref:zinc transporter ZIP3 n=1 Tax=Rhinichthys klamathensis goyatoka TaxID=3034132 RepID=UPI0024B5197C|nr:zinc transporter ZIP3 [Rhinichthys klamathensis goyatoka]
MCTGCGLQIEPAMLTLMLCFSLLCGFGPVCVIRRVAGVRLGVMSLASCLSDGVFLCSCLLDLLPDYLTHARETFSRLGLALHFPLAEFIVSMGFLLVFVSEQMLLAFRDPTSYESLEKKALIDPHVTKSRDSPGRSHHLSGADESLEKQALIDPHMTQSRDSPGRSWTDESLEKQLLIDPHMAQSRDSPGHSHRLSGTDGSASPEHVGLRVLLLVFCLCVCALVEGLSAGSQLDPELILQIGVTLFLRQAIMAFSLSVRMSHYGLRQAVASGCLILFSLSCPVGIGIRMGMGMVGMNPSATVQLVRCAVEGLASGIFIYVSIAGLLWQESASPKHRIHKVTFLLTGFALVTAVLFCKV